jgi:hypothetical protein
MHKINTFKKLPHYKPRFFLTESNGLVELIKKFAFCQFKYRKDECGSDEEVVYRNFPTD